MASTLTDRLNGVNGGVAQKAPVKFATTANITLSGVQTIDSISTAGNVDCLVKDQTDQTENGIYITSTGNWTRRPDADGNRDLVKGTEVYVTDGTLNGNTLWSLRADTDSVVIGTTEITFENFASIISSDFLTVLLTSAAANDFIRYNGTNWVNFALYGANNTFTGSNVFSGASTLNGKFSSTTGSNLVIASGIITPVAFVHTIDTEGAASSDNLTTISGGADGQFLVISPVNSSRDVIVDNTGNIYIHGSASITLSDTSTTLLLVYRASISKWIVLSRDYLSYIDSQISLVKIQSSSIVNTTSGAFVDVTGIPAGVKRIHILLSGVSTNGTSSIIIQIGDSGGIETSGYSGTSTRSVGTSVSNTSNTTGFIINSNTAATDVITGRVILDILDESTFEWVCSGYVSRTDAAAQNITSGSKSTTTELTQIRLTTSGGTDTFDAGKMKIMYEY